MGVLGNILGTPSSITITTSIDGDYTVGFNDTRIEVDCTLGNVIITLPTITDAFKMRPEIQIKRIDDSLNTLTINGTGGNYEDDGFVIFGLGGTIIYASSTNIWRSSL